MEVSDEENKHEFIVYETFLILRNTDVNPILMISGSLSATRSDIAHLRVAGRLRYISPGLGSSGGEWRVVSSAWSLAPGASSGLTLVTSSIWTGEPTPVSVTLVM